MEPHGTAQAISGASLISLALLFNLTFTLLARRFDYPEVLRRPVGEVLAAFHAGGAGLRLLWWAFASSALLLVPSAPLLAAALQTPGDALREVGLALGVAAGLVQAIGLVRWPFAVPELARVHADPARSPTEREAAALLFDTLNRTLGVGVGEHLGYLLTGLWTGVTGAAILQSDAVASPLGWVGLALAPLFVLGSLEFVGRAEPVGSRVAGAVVPVTYAVWSLWLIAVGVGLLV